MHILEAPTTVKADNTNDKQQDSKDNEKMGDTPMEALSNEENESTIITINKEYESFMRYVNKVAIPTKGPSWLAVFLGQVFDTQENLIKLQDKADSLIIKLQHLKSTTTKQIDLESKLIYLSQSKTSASNAFEKYSLSPLQLWLYQWSVVLLLGIIGVVQIIFIEIYVRWHGTSILTLDLYKTREQVNLLSQISFVNGPTTLSVALEILVWSSVGVWAQQTYSNSIKMLQRTFRFADDGPIYIGLMVRNTSVAAAIIILLRLTQFSVFGLSLDASSPLAFDATIGLSFILGFFGNEASALLASFRDKLISNVNKSDEDKK